MVVVMQERASEAQIEQGRAPVLEMGMDVHRSTGVTRTVLGRGRTVVILTPHQLEMLDVRTKSLRISEPYKLASRTFKPEGDRSSSVGDVRIGGDEVIVMAGPCSAESEPQVRAATPRRCRRAGAKIFRGGAFSRAARLTASRARRGRAAAAARRGERGRT